MLTQTRPCVRFVSREMQVAEVEGLDRAPGMSTPETRVVSAQEERCKDMHKMARFADGRWKTARTRHVHVTGEKIATMESINRLE